MKQKFKIFLTVCLAVCCLFFAVPVHADSPTDEITDYQIQVSVNEDATLDMTYTISWKVLESDSLGPVTWLSIGVANSHISNLKAESDNIEDISSDGSYVRVDFDDQYYEDETVTFSFSLTQDNVYQMNQDQDGYTTYNFTPGWFDEVAIDNLTIRWDDSKVDSWSPQCKDTGGYLTWQAELNPGDTYPITVTYPNDAYEFAEWKSNDSADDYGSYDDYDSYDDDDDFLFDLFAVIIVFGIPIFFIRLMIRFFRSLSGYSSGSGFQSGASKKITRTKITYYDNCPRCNAPRGEGETICSYCGGSLVKSEEVLSEKELKSTEKAAAKYRTDGEYRYSDSPNVYIRVHTVMVPRSAPPHRGSGPRRGSGGGHHSSCAHSSCAHSSCAHSSCACACACAGGGRAGCTNKDFYNTDLKLRQLEQRKKSKREKQI